MQSSSSSRNPNDALDNSLTSFVTIGSALAFVGISLGAFGAHALKGSLSSESIAIYQTGVQYHLFHALALVVLGGMRTHQDTFRFVQWAGRLFCVGVAIFAGSLYLLAITGIKRLGAITPLGGLCFLGGWALLIYAHYRAQKNSGETEN
jgi:uncharacterized membrane protein YgdD (TMEM256/DUF423 family)